MFYVAKFFPSFFFSILLYLIFYKTRKNRGKVLIQIFPPT